MIASPLFSINRYDRDGDLVEEGVFLHFGSQGPGVGTMIKVCDKPEEFTDFVQKLADMTDEIEGHN